MINNRQGGRRRGRGGQGGGRNLGGQPGNRQDNRQRGNAAQLLEKYKSMARDSQLAGDRVQAEYYLQYADHYFRVLSENRSKFEDQRPKRDDESDDYEGDDEMAEAGESEHQGQSQPQDRQERFSRRDRGPRRFDRHERDDRGQAAAEDEPVVAERLNGGDDSLPLDVLPPAIGADAPASVVTSDDEQPEPRPRRRARTSRPADDDEVTPAA